MTIKGTVKLKGPKNKEEQIEYMFTHLLVMILAKYSETSNRKRKENETILLRLKQ